VSETIKTKHRFFHGHGEKTLPIEVFDVDEFVELSGKATECRIKRNPGNVKLKLRASRRLYTLKLEPGEEGEVISKLRCPTVDV
jgi:hypothetical protein